jgi:allophanate hydrolase
MDGRDHRTDREPMNLAVGELLAAYRDGRLIPSVVAAEVTQRVMACEQPSWISTVPADLLAAAAARLDLGDRALPLYGIPFAVKDNIDVAGMETTAGCPGFAYVAERSATVVERLIAAGALFVGKTNMDQFATGLVGMRSPYGRCSSVFDPARVSGGSSSGSAVAVALGQVSFALGTDTAGSGRVPAAFNEIVGIKPTRGLLSNRGVVPACASLDCVSVFAADLAGAAAVLAVAEGFDDEDPYSRRAYAPSTPRHGRIAVPIAEQLGFDDDGAHRAWADALAHAGEHWDIAEVDITPLLEAAPLLYDAWVAERAADLSGVVAAGPAGLDPTVARIVLSGSAVTGARVFQAQHRVAALRRAAAPIWDGADALLMPTVPGHPTHDDVTADPVGVNERLGRFTNFVNLMDLTALALPGPRRGDGLPSGVTLLAPAFHDRRLVELGAQWSGLAPPAARPGTVPLAVVGAHMSGLALNRQLTERGGRLAAKTRTAAIYRLYALPGSGVRRPGLVRSPDGEGCAIDAEVWDMAPAALGELLAQVPAPLAIGRVTLEDGSEVAGFVCEAYAAATAEDVSAFGGWRAYLGNRASEVV